MGVRRNAGWSRGLLAKAEEALVEFGSIGAIVIHKGRIALATGAIDGKIVVRSVRKSVLSALIGIEVGRGTIRLDATMEELGIGDVEALSTYGPPVG